MRSILRAAVGGIVWSCLSWQAAWADDSSPPRSESPVATKHARLLAALQTTAEALRSRSLEPTELASFEELLAAAEIYWQDAAVPLDRRGKWCGLAKARLAEGAAVLRRQAAAANQAAKRASSVRPRTTTLAQVAPQGFPPPGGAVNAAATEAEQLMDLIQSVVRPETWDVNGGQGVMKYWSLGHGLVIYNTGDVHERIGGSIGFLRK